MTSVLQPNQLWSSMPGWGIVTDLTPPELVSSRRLKLVRKFLLACLVLLLVLLAAGYAYAALQSRSAQSALADEQVRTIQLRAEQNRYGAVTRVGSSIDAVQHQVAGLMSGDVDLTAELGQFRSALPASMALTELDLTVSQVGTAAASGGSTGSLDTSGHPQIGKVRMTGGGRSMDDLANYVAALQKIPGVVDVLPLSNQSSGNTFQFSLSLSLTNQVLSHKYDITGSK